MMNYKHRNLDLKDLKEILAYSGLMPWGKAVSAEDCSEATGRYLTAAGNANCKDMVNIGSTARFWHNNFKGGPASCDIDGNGLPDC